MFRQVYITRFDRLAANGRNSACFAECTSLEDASRREAVVKFSGLCESGIGTLIRESLAAFFAADLGLPIPEPLLVSIPSGFSTGNPDLDRRISRGSSHGFGSSKLGAGYTIYAPAMKLGSEQLQSAAEIFAFDTFIANGDRAPRNPNCMVNGADIRIIDHDVSFLMDSILFWKAPWELKGGEELSQIDKHIFWTQVYQRKIDFNRMKQALTDISDVRVQSYIEALPDDWKSGNQIAQNIVKYIIDLRNAADEAFAELQRVLS